MIQLRQLRKEDVPQLYEMYLEYPRMICHDKVFAVDWMEKVAADDSQLRFAITVDDVLGRSKVIGCATLWWLSWFDHIASPTIWIGENYQRRGYAEKALRQLLEEGSSQMGVRKIVANVYEYNKASLALFRKVFGPEVAVLSNHVFYRGEYYAQYYFQKEIV